MLNLFKRPIEVETLEAWAKMVEDIANVVILAVPVIIFGQNGILFKIMSSLTLMLLFMPLSLLESCLENTNPSYQRRIKWNSSLDYLFF